MGLLLVHPLTRGAAVVPAFLTGGAIYFFVAQAFGFAVGGHLAGRLLGFEAETPAQEDFRAGAHGFAAWAVTVLATLTMLALAGLTVASTGAATAALYGVTPAAVKTQTTPTAYLVDQLFRPAKGGAVSASPGSVAARAEAGRILDAGLAHGEQISTPDHARLTALTAAEAGLSEDEASARIDRLQADVQAATRKAADIAQMTALLKSNERLFKKALNTRGLKIVVGTDAVAGAFGHQADEIIARIGLGQAAMDAIDDATSVNAESLRLGNRIGSIAQGYDADIIAVQGNPLADAASLRQVSFVMKGGTVYKDMVSAPGR